MELGIQKHTIMTLSFQRTEVTADRLAYQRRWGGEGGISWSAAEDIWALTHTKPSSPSTDTACVSPFFYFSQACFCRLNRDGLHIAVLCAVSLVKAAVILFETKISAFTRKEAHRALFISAITNGNPLQKQPFFSLCGRKVGPNIKHFFPSPPKKKDFRHPCFLLWERYENEQRHYQSSFMGALGWREMELGLSLVKAKNIQSSFSFF